MTFKACVHSLQKVIQVSMDVPGQEHEWTFRVLVEPPRSRGARLARFIGGYR